MEILPKEIILDITPITIIIVVAGAFIMGYIVTALTEWELRRREKK